MSQAFCIHIVVLVALMLGTSAILRTARRWRRSIWGEILDRALLLSLGMSWLIVAICFFVTRRTLNPLGPSGLVVLIAPLALSMRRAPLRAILYYWGVSLTAQTILNPLRIAPLTLDFCVYWFAHAAMMVAVGYDLVANRYKPGIRDCAWACVTAWVYHAIFPPVDSNPQELFHQMLWLAAGFGLLTIPWLLPRRSAPARAAQSVPEMDDSELVYTT